MASSDSLLMPVLAWANILNLWDLEMKQITDKDRIQWLEDMHTLHGVVEILYVVDGYQLTYMYHDSQIGDPVHGKTLSSAIENAINAGWEPLNRREKK